MKYIKNQGIITVTGEHMKGMEEIIDQVARDKISCYFISPHLDDAALSAGGLITYLASKTPVKIITIFTEGAPGPYTFVMRRFLKKCGYTNALELFESRRQEDKSAFGFLPVEIKHLGFVDGSFRKRKTFKILEDIGNVFPEVVHRYPLGRKIGKLANEDGELMREIQEKIQTLLPTKGKCIIFCPLGTVKHMDHEITQKVCVSLFSSLNHITHSRLIFWRDYPYITNKQYTNVFIEENHLHDFIWNKNLEEKKKLIQGYTSQLTGMFPDGKVPLVTDTFYIGEKYIP